MKGSTIKTKLPKQYTVGGQQMNIREVERIDDERLGQCCLGEGTVDIAKTFRGMIQSETSKRNTLYHEIVHTILDTMGEHDLSANEKFVCSFSGFLTEVISTLK